MGTCARRCGRASDAAGAVCPACRAEESARRARWRRERIARRVAAGLCGVPKCTAPVRPGRTTCAGCGAAAVEKNRRDRARAAGAQVEDTRSVVAKLNDYDAVM